MFTGWQRNTYFRKGRKAVDCYYIGSFNIANMIFFLKEKK